MNQDNSTDSQIFSSFKPQNSGQLDRWLFKADVRNGEADAASQATGLRTTTPTDSNANTNIYQSTVEFQQPAIIGIGGVTSAGVFDTARPRYSQNWTISKPSTGTYTITHNIGEDKYFVHAIPTTTGDSNLVISYATNTFTIRTFTAGAAADIGFTFVVYLIS